MLTTRKIWSTKETIWANHNNHNNSLTWKDLIFFAILGWFPLLTMIPVRSQWGRYNLPRTMVVCGVQLASLCEFMNPREPSVTFRSMLCWYSIFIVPVIRCSRAAIAFQYGCSVVEKLYLMKFNTWEITSKNIANRGYSSLPESVTSRTWKRATIVWGKWRKTNPDFSK